jgi:small subunit ribosomal protein S3
MGQKANLNGLHLSILKDWNSIWYLSFTEYSKILNEDFLLYKFLRLLNVYKKSNKKIQIFSIIKIRICRISNNIIVKLYYSFELKLKRTKRTTYWVNKWKNWKKNKIHYVTTKILLTINKLFLNTKNLYIGFFKINSVLVKREVSFIAKKIAFLIENRVKFRSRLIKKIIVETKKLSLWVFVSCSGRLNGADIARTDFISQGAIPFQTLHKNIHYSSAIANTTKGLQNIKVCIYKS